MRQLDALKLFDFFDCKWTNGITKTLPEFGLKRACLRHYLCLFLVE